MPGWLYDWSGGEQKRTAPAGHDTGDADGEVTRLRGRRRIDLPIIVFLALALAMAIFDLAHAISSLNGTGSPLSFPALSRPATGSPLGSSKPICTRTDAWSQ